jgi:hypothetical protein
MNKSQSFNKKVNFEGCTSSESDTKALLKHAEHLIDESKRNRKEIEKTLNQINPSTLTNF